MGVRPGALPLRGSRKQSHQKLLDSEVSRAVCTSPSSNALPGDADVVALDQGWSGILPKRG